MSALIRPSGIRRAEHANCRVCKVPLVPQYTWRYLTPEARKGKAAHGAHGFCLRHYSQHKRGGPKPRSNRAPATAAEVPVSNCEDCGDPMTYRENLNRFPELKEKLARIGGQGHCRRCYQRARAHGKLEVVVRRADDVLDEWVMLRDDGHADVRTAARRMGMTFAALDMALYRARKKGDPRGSLTPFAHRRYAA